jgi:hypothetical protein
VALVHHPNTGLAHRRVGSNCRRHVQAGVRWYRGSRFPSH